MHFEVKGNGPPVVLITGLGGLGSFWQPIMERLADHFTCITFDHPGVGRSPPPVTHTIEGIARGVIALLDQLGIASAHLVGHSTGGLVAQVLALDHAARTGRVVLSATWARPDRHFRDLFELRRTVLERAGFGAYNTMGKLLGYPAGWYESHFAPARSIDFDADAPGDKAPVVARINMLLGFDRSAELANIRLPVLVLGASDDNLVPVHHSRDLARRIAGASLVEMQGGHFFPHVVTGQYCETLRQFLAAS